MNTKEKILKAALEIVGERGTSELTIRGIVERTGVNVSAINYHFGDKEKLISRVLSAFTEKVRHNMEFIDNRDIPPAQRLEQFLNTYMENLKSYPGLVRSMFISMISQGRMVPELRTVVFGVMERLIPLVSEVIGVNDQETCRMVLMQMAIRVLYPIVAGDMLLDTLGTDFADAKTRKKYVDLIMKSVESLKGWV